MQQAVSPLFGFVSRNLALPDEDRPAKKDTSKQQNIRAAFLRAQHLMHLGKSRWAACKQAAHEADVNFHTLYTDGRGSAWR